MLSSNDDLIFDVCYCVDLLPIDMESMGYFFEYCEVYVYELYGIESMDKIKFLTDFMNSYIRMKMERGNGQLLCHPAKETLMKFVIVDLENNVEQYRTDTGIIYKDNEMFWIGMFYALMHFKTKEPSSLLIEAFPIEDMRKMYYLGHEFDIYAYYDRNEKAFEEHIKEIKEKRGA